MSQDPPHAPEPTSLWGRCKRWLGRTWSRLRRPPTATTGDKVALTDPGLVADLGTYEACVLSTVSPMDSLNDTWEYELELTRADTESAPATPDSEPGMPLTIWVTDDHISTDWDDAPGRSAVARAANSDSRAVVIVDHLERYIESAFASLGLNARVALDDTYRPHVELAGGRPLPASPDHLIEEMTPTADPIGGPPTAKSSLTSGRLTTFTYQKPVGADIEEVCRYAPPAENPIRFALGATSVFAGYYAQMDEVDRPFVTAFVDGLARATGADPDSLAIRVETDDAEHVIDNFPAAVAHKCDSDSPDSQSSQQSDHSPSTNGQSPENDSHSDSSSTDASDDDMDIEFDADIDDDHDRDSNSGANTDSDGDTDADASANAESHTDTSYSDDDQSETTSSGSGAVSQSSRTSSSTNSTASDTAPSRTAPSEALEAALNDIDP